MSSYDNPLGKDGIVASLIYNELRDPDMPFINLEERNKVTIIKLKVDKKSSKSLRLWVLCRFFVYPFIGD